MGIEKKISDIQKKILIFRRMAIRAKIEVTKNTDLMQSSQEEWQESLKAIQTLKQHLKTASKKYFGEEKSTELQEIKNQYNTAVNHFEDIENQYNTAVTHFVDKVKENVIKAKPPEKLMGILTRIIDAITGGNFLADMSTIKPTMQAEKERYKAEKERYKAEKVRYKQESKFIKENLAERQGPKEIEQKVDDLLKMTSRSIKRLNKEATQQYKEALATNAGMPEVNKFLKSLETLHARLGVIQSTVTATGLIDATQMEKNYKAAVKKFVENVAEDTINVDEITITAKPPKKLLEVLRSILHDITGIKFTSADQKRSEREATIESTIKEDFKISKAKFIALKNEAQEDDQEDKPGEAPTH